MFGMYKQGMNKNQEEHFVTREVLDHSIVKHSELQNFHFMGTHVGGRITVLGIHHLALYLTEKV
ncbi:hypothetical protein E2320_013741 [Naja naja]|nr:hypothetical protein E2320_013741 [Naja naja]